MSPQTHFDRRRTTIYFSRDTIKKLKVHCAESNIEMSETVNEAVRQFLLNQRAYEMIGDVTCEKCRQGQHTGETCATKECIRYAPPGELPNQWTADDLEAELAASRLQIEVWKTKAERAGAAAWRAECERDEYGEKVIQMRRQVTELEAERDAFEGIAKQMEAEWLREFQRLDFGEYQAAAATTADYARMGRNPNYPALGLAGEAGEVCEHIKKVERDDAGIVTRKRRRALKKELGDVLWYIATLCTELDLSLADVAQGNLDKLADRKARGVIHGAGDER